MSRQRKILIAAGAACLLLLTASCCICWASSLATGVRDVSTPPIPSRPASAVASGEAPSEAPGAPEPRLPEDPPPPVAHRAEEVPRLEHELAAMEAYRGIWGDAQRENLRVLLTAVSELLTAGGMTRDAAAALDERGLREAATTLYLIHARIGRYPDDFTRSLEAYLDAVRDEEHRGTWAPREAGRPPHDFAALAAWTRRTDAGLLREHIAARRVLGWQRPPEGEPRFPYLSRELDALERLDLLADLTNAEERRLAFLRIPNRRSDRVEHGGVAYTITHVEARDSIGRGVLRIDARPGATFVVVDYSAENLGPETETEWVTPFRFVDAQGRRFDASTDATTRLHGRDVALFSQLQPGIVTPFHAAFEVPDDSAASWFTVVFDGGAFGADTTIAVDADLGGRGGRR